MMRQTDAVQARAQCTLLSNARTVCPPTFGESNTMIHLGSQFRQTTDAPNEISFQLRNPATGVRALRLVAAEVPNTGAQVTAGARNVYFSERRDDGGVTTFCAKLPLGSPTFAARLIALDQAMGVALPVSAGASAGDRPLNDYYATKVSATERLSIMTVRSTVPWALHCGASERPVSGRFAVFPIVQLDDRAARAAAGHTWATTADDDVVVDDMAVVRVRVSVDGRLVDGGLARALRVDSFPGDAFGLVSVGNSSVPYAAPEGTDTGGDVTLALAHWEGNIAPRLGFTRGSVVGARNRVSAHRIVDAGGALASSAVRLVTDAPHMVPVDSPDAATRACFLVDGSGQRLRATARADNLGDYALVVDLADGATLGDAARGLSFVRGAPSTFNRGGDLVVAADKFDPTTGRRLCFVVVDLPGVGAVGNIVTNIPTEGSRVVVGRLQMPYGPDSIEFPMNDNLVGLSALRQPTTVEHLRVRLLDEAMQPMHFEGVAWSLLLELVSV